MTSVVRMTALVLACLMLLALANGSGCARLANASYAAAYQSALDRYAGTPNVTPAMADRFIDFFNHGSGSDTPVSAEDLYAGAVYFSDTLLTSEDHATVVRHVDRMKASANRMRVEVLGRVVDGQDVFLIWRMRTSFEAAGREVASDTLGVSHLRFDSQGRIVLQQDFWDSAEGLYRHLPVMGRLIDYVRGRFDDDSA